MSVTARIKQKSLFKKKMNLEDIIKFTGLSYGVCDENYRLDRDEIGEHTLIYDEAKLARGFELWLEGSDVLLSLSLPTAPSEIRLFYSLVEKLCNEFNTKKYLREDEEAYLYEDEEFIKWDEQDRSKAQYKNDWICVKTGICQGRLIGGNLNTMEGFFGTEYMPEIRKGDILFIEDSLKDACTIERSFSLLRLAGVFDRVSGIILGKHEKFDDNGTGRKPYEILQEVLGETEIPVLAEFDCCHTHPMFTLPLGCQVRLDAENKTVSLLESPFVQ